jgi:hypothetical protein
MSRFVQQSKAPSRFTWVVRALLLGACVGAAQLASAATPGNTPTTNDVVCEDALPGNEPRPAGR